MKWFVHFLTAAAIVAVAFADDYPSNSQGQPEETHFAYQTKTFADELEECRQYLDIPKEAVDQLVTYNYVTDDIKQKGLIRCVGINAQWWNTTIGLKGPVLEQYFQPGPDDVCYSNRTQECIATKTSACQDDCSRAYETFLCHFQQQGNLQTSEQYVPVPYLDGIQAAYDCMKILRISEKQLKSYVRGEFSDDPETQCLYRCQYLAEGVYTPDKGFSLPRLYARFGYAPNPAILSPDVQACIDSKLQSNCNECKRVYDASYCFANFGAPHHSANLFTQAAKLALADKTCYDEDLNPRYNTSPCDYTCPSAPAAPTSDCKYNC